MRVACPEVTRNISWQGVPLAPLSLGDASFMAFAAAALVRGHLSCGCSLFLGTRCPKLRSKKPRCRSRCPKLHGLSLHRPFPPQFATARGSTPPRELVFATSRAALSPKAAAWAKEGKGRVGVESAQGAQERSAKGHKRPAARRTFFTERQNLCVGDRQATHIAKNCGRGAGLARCSARRPPFGTRNDNQLCGEKVRRRIPPGIRLLVAES